MVVGGPDDTETVSLENFPVIRVVSVNEGHSRTQRCRSMPSVMNSPRGQAMHGSKFQRSQDDSQIFVQDCDSRRQFDQ